MIAVCTISTFNNVEENLRLPYCHVCGHGHSVRSTYAIYNLAETSICAVTVKQNFNKYQQGS